MKRFFYLLGFLYALLLLCALDDGPFLAVIYSERVERTMKALGVEW